MDETFSKRYGYHQPSAIEITVRYEAPHELRGVVVQFAYRCGFRPKSLRILICDVLKKRPDLGNWGEYPNIDEEVHELIDNCEWYRVYDIIEGITERMRETPHAYNEEKFKKELNDYFLENGIGWKLVEGKIELRGSEIFEQTVQSAESQLQSKGFDTRES